MRQILSRFCRFQVIFREFWLLLVKYAAKHFAFSGKIAQKDFAFSGIFGPTGRDLLPASLQNPCKRPSIRPRRCRRIPNTPEKILKEFPYSPHRVWPDACPRPGACAYSACPETRQNPPAVRQGR